MSEFVLEMIDVSKSFPGVHALKNVSFRLRPGSVHALMGENGAGKSTLMKIVAGVYIPDQGNMRLREQEIRLTSPTGRPVEFIVGGLYLHSTTDYSYYTYYNGFPVLGALEIWKK